MTSGKTSIRRGRLKSAISFFNRYKKNRAALLGAFIVFFFSVIALFAPVISPYDPYNQDLRNRLSPPDSKYLLGTDRFGRDLLSGIIWGARTSLYIGVLSTVIATFLGIILGSISGYFGGGIDEIIMRIVDVILVIPTFFLILIIVAIWGSNVQNILLVLAFTSWPGLCRLIRAQFLSVKSKTFVEAALNTGASNFHIIFREILPNVIHVAIVRASLQISGSIMTEASLSFLGLGDPNNISWGYMLNAARIDIYAAWWTSIFPGIMITLTVLAFNLIGDGLNDALNPTLKEK